MSQVIAIDGPAGSGKSTTARLVARQLNWVYIDTGAMYRAITLLALDNHIPISDHQAIITLSKTARVDMDWAGEELRIFLNGRDVTSGIRTSEVTSHVSAVSAIQELRAVMVEKQRELARGKNVVMEGRDIGTHVFPDADFKFFLVASLEERAKRRMRDFELLGKTFSIEEVIETIKQRDQYDSTRECSPLKKADDAVEVDTTHMTINDQVNFIVDRVKKQHPKEDQINVRNRKQKQ